MQDEDNEPSETTAEPTSADPTTPTDQEQEYIPGEGVDREPIEVVGSTTLIDDNGDEVTVYEIEIDGHPALLADMYGDGFYDQVLDVDGNPVSITTPDPDHDLNHFIAQANITDDDLRGMLGSTDEADPLVGSDSFAGNDVSPSDEIFVGNPSDEDVGLIMAQLESNRHEMNGDERGFDIEDPIDGSGETFDGDYFMPHDNGFDTQEEEPMDGDDDGSDELSEWHGGDSDDLDIDISD